MAPISTQLAGERDSPRDLEAVSAEHSFNIARSLPRMADHAAARRAIVVSQRARRGLVYQSLTFAELESLSNRYAHGLGAAGIERGQRVLLMVRQGFDFVALVFALFKMGAVPVLIDPGMGVRRLLECVRTVDLHALVGVPAAHALRAASPKPFRGIRTAVTVGRRWFWNGPTLEELARRASDRFDTVATKTNDTAAILFTSGSTGPAKGVVYEHGMFSEQVRLIQSTYGIRPGEVDLPTFPLFSLFSVAMGMTMVLPDMDPSHPARVNPANVVDAIRDHEVTNTFGSPALWRRVAAYCTERRIRLPTLRRILVAGAAVPRRVIEQLHGVLSADADVHTPYGATESLPISTISGREVVHDTAAATDGGAGTCVGRPVADVEVRIIRIVDGPLPNWSDVLPVSDGEIGEICVRGSAVTKAYFGRPLANSLSKIHDGETIWHRVGDVGYRDMDGRLWFCGRKSQRVVTGAGTLYTECVEPVFNQHPDVARCALVGVGPAGARRPALVVEPQRGRFPRRRRTEAFRSELQRLIARSQTAEPLPRESPRRNHSAMIDPERLMILFRRSLPVDIRHNAKINRENLARWAEGRVRRRRPGE